MIEKYARIWKEAFWRWRELHQLDWLTAVAEPNAVKSLRVASFGSRLFALGSALGKERLSESTARDQKPKVIAARAAYK
jgi:hypothetical protein